MSDSLRLHESQHARPPCPSKLPEFIQTHAHRVGDAIQPSHPLSPPSPQTTSVFLPQEPHEQYEKGIKWAGAKIGGTDLGHLVSEEGTRNHTAKAQSWGPDKG